MDYRKRRKIYLFLFNKMRLPRAAATALVKGGSFLLDPSPYFRRRHAARSLPAPGPALRVPQDKGYASFSPDALPGTTEVIEECRRVFEAAKASGQLDRLVQDASKRFLVPVAESQDALMKLPAIRDFVLSPALLATVADYFGSMPILSAVDLLWSPTNDTVLKSQKFHFDAEDYRQLKLFLHIFDVDDACGPFTLVPSDVSAEIGRKSGYTGGRRTRLDDEIVQELKGEVPSIPIMGPAGSGFFCDTSRCLHFGSRGNRKERLVLMVQFMGYYAPKLEPTDWRKASAALDPGLDGPRRLLMQLT